VMALAVAIMTRPAFFRATTGPPDLDRFRCHGGFGRGFYRRGVAFGNGLRRAFSSGLFLRRCRGAGFDSLSYGRFNSFRDGSLGRFHGGRFHSFHHSSRFRLRRLDGDRLSRVGRGRERNIGQQRR